jgi:hypothetical protein
MSSAGVRALYSLKENMLAMVPPKDVLPMSCSKSPMQAWSSNLQAANFFATLPATTANMIGNAVTDCGDSAKC